MGIRDPGAAGQMRNATIAVGITIPPIRPHALIRRNQNPAGGNRVGRPGVAVKASQIENPRDPNITVRGEGKVEGGKGIREIGRVVVLHVE